MKPSITATDRLVLIGLLALAKDHNARMEDVKRSVCKVLGIERSTEHQFNDPADHVSDAVYSDFDADLLLSKLQVGVVDGE